MFESNTTLSLNTTVITADLGDELLMMDIQQGFYYALDDIGKLIWESLQQPKTLATLCDQLADLYDVERSTLEADVQRFLKSLHDESLLHVAA